MLKDSADRDRARHLLEAVGAGEREQRRPLPAALAERLRALPAGEVPCEEVERLYLAALSQLRISGDPESEDSAARRHLESCARCRALYAPLRAMAPSSAHRAAPGRLKARLRAIARRPRPAPWLPDTRYAAAVCLLTASLLTAAGNLQAKQLIEVTRGVGQRTESWISSGRRGGVGIVEWMGSSLDKAVLRGQELSRDGSTIWRQFVETTGEQLRRLPAMLDVDTSPNEGENHGNEQREDGPARS